MASRCSADCCLRSLNVSAPKTKRPKAVEAIPPRDPDQQQGNQDHQGAPEECHPLLSGDFDEGRNPKSN